jgi:hypothetical protein
VAVLALHEVLALALSRSPCRLQSRRAFNSKHNVALSISVKISRNRLSRYVPTSARAGPYSECGHSPGRLQSWRRKRETELSDMASASTGGEAAVQVKGQNRKYGSV